MKAQQLFASIAVLALVLVGSGCQSQAVDTPTSKASPATTQTQLATVSTPTTESIALIPGEAEYETKEPKAYADSDNVMKEAVGMELEKITKIPRNKAEIKDSCAKAPDMFTDSDEFIRVLGEYTKLIEIRILPKYIGPVLTPGAGVGLGTDSIFLTRGAEVSPVACLDSEGNLIFSFVVANRDGTLSIMHVSLDRNQANHNPNSRIALADVLANFPISIGDDSTTIELATKPEKKPDSLDDTPFSKKFWMGRGDVHAKVFEWLSGKKGWESIEIVLLKTFYLGDGVGSPQISPVVNP